MNVNRLSGDYNPLHIDPNMAAMGGFDVPILHGLATFGIAGKHIFKTYCKNDPSLFKSIKVRFAKHVFPGETIETHMWKEGSKVIFIVKVVERDVIAVSNAAVELNEGSGSAVASAPVKAPSAGGVSVPGFEASKIFAGIHAALSSLDASTKSAQIKKIKAVFAFDIKNAQGQTQSWYIDLKNDGSIGTGKPAGKADLTVAIADADFLLIAAGSLNPQKAFSQGKLKVKGNVALAT